MRIQQEILAAIRNILLSRFQNLRTFVHQRESENIAESYLKMKQALSVAEQVIQTPLSPTDPISQELDHLVKKIKTKLNTHHQNWEFPFIYTLQETLTENYQAINTLIQSKQLVQGAQKVRQFEKLCHLIDQCPWSKTANITKFLNIKNKIQKHVREKTASLTKYTNIIKKRKKILQALSNPKIKLDLLKTNKVLEKIQKNSQKRFSSDLELHRECQQNIDTLNTKISSKLITLLTKEINKKQKNKRNISGTQHQINFFYATKNVTI